MWARLPGVNRQAAVRWLVVLAARRLPGTLTAAATASAADEGDGP
jgi:hypothetical protein